MAPGNKERHPGHTGTIPKTKVRNNCNVPQEAVTPTRRDMASNLVTTSLDWVPVSEYNARSNCNQSRKQTNNTSDQELTDLDNSVAYESGFGRFVPVRPQPRVLPLTVQNRDNLPTDQHDDAASTSSHTLHPYAHQMQNGMIPHSNHAAAAVMIVNPTTPNAVAGNMSQTFNGPNQNRNNLTRNLNSTRNTFEGNNTNNNNTPISNSRSGTKSVNLMNNMYDQGQGSFNNVNENNQAHRESARALGEAIVAACPDAAAVERRLGQIREYIRVTSSLVDTMRNSEDEQDVVVRPVSVQSNGSVYSDNELWQNEIKNKMELSQIRLTALKQQQKRLLKYQAEAKQQLEELNKERQSQEIPHPSTSHENFGAMQNLTLSANYHHPNRMYGANQIGVATTLPQCNEPLTQQLAASNVDCEHARSTHSAHSHDERFSLRDGNVASSEEAAGGGRDSEVEDDEGLMNDRGRMLQIKLRELQLKKQHMENLVSEFQKLQLATRIGSSHNTYSSSGEDSGDEESSRKCNKSGVNLKNEDPFKLMEIKAIKTALQKTKDLMRSVETFEADNLSGVSQHEDSFHLPGHSNIHDNKSEGGGSMGGGSIGGWSNEDSVCRVRNTLPQRHKFTNEQHSQQVQHQQHLQAQQQHLQAQQQHMQAQQQHMQAQQHQQHLQTQHQQHQQQNHEANLNSLQELAQELRMETEKIIGERARIKDMVTNKERKQKKVNEEVRSRAACVPGPAERRQMQLRALLADKQRELEALLNKETINPTSEVQMKPDSRAASVVNQSYNSEQEEPESRSEHVAMDSQNSRDTENFRGGGDSVLGARSVNTVPSHIGSAYGSDSDSASRNKSNQRNRTRRRPTQDRQPDENNIPMTNNNANVRHEPRADSANVNLAPPTAQNNEAAANAPYSHLPPTCWNTTKSNQQDMRTNQFTQNSHSQTMDRLLGTPQMSFPPALPYNMMMPYGMVGGCGCGCGFWGAWCWQQLVLQQREIHQLRDQLTHLEERWRAETASHTLNNQVPPGNRANNYWDNFRSYSRQNLLSANSKSNAEGQAAHGAHPLAERSHNTLHHTSSSTSPSLTPKRNTDAPPAAPPPPPDDGPRPPRRNLAYERSLSFSSAPDVLNVNQNPEPDAARADDPPTNRRDPPHNARNLDYTNPIPEIIQSHSNNLNAPTNKKKSKPSKNSAAGRNRALDFSPTSNIDIASASSDAPNPNLATAGREVQDKATSKLFDLLRENIYSEVTTLIDVNESHPDFLIQLFRELQLISSDPLRQRVLQSIRGVLAQCGSLAESRGAAADDTVTTTSAEAGACQDCGGQSACSNTVQIDNKIVCFLLMRREEIFTLELLESLASLILNGPADSRRSRRLVDLLSKYEGMRVCDVSSDIVENLPVLSSGTVEGEESAHLTSEISESSILQDVAGSLNLFSSSETRLHQMNACPYDMWPGHVHMDIDGADINDGSPRSSREDKVDLIDCSEMQNGDLAEADQTCRAESGDVGADGHELPGNAEALPDVVDTEEVTPTEAEAEWLGLDRVPTRLHMEESSEKQKD